eukprot:7996238-Alexandrium_andersonii.AAC.1
MEELRGLPAWSTVQLLTRGGLAGGSRITNASIASAAQPLPVISYSDRGGSCALAQETLKPASQALRLKKHRFVIGPRKLCDFLGTVISPGVRLARHGAQVC